MSSMEEMMAAACAAQEIPFAVMVAIDRSGNFTYANKFGKRALDSSEDVELGSIMWIASCTKLLTSISVLQLVEQGRLTLDEDVSKYAPEVKDLEILTDFDEETGKAITQPNSKVITMRQLLTHTSGMSYGIFNPILRKWRASRGEKPSDGQTVQEKYGTPLLYPPGEKWEYSGALDWAGKTVERISNKTLEEYFEEHIWKPLDIRDMTFWMKNHPELQKRLTTTYIRPEVGAKLVADPNPDPTRGATDGFGGGGLYSSLPDYLKILHSILKDDEKLLQSKTIDDMFSPQLGEGSKKALNELLQIPVVNRMLGGVPAEITRDWGLAGMLMEGNIDGWRNEGTLFWGGMRNLQWWIDRTAGLCGIWGTQVLPPGDCPSIELAQVFEKAMYERLASSKSKI